MRVEMSFDELREMLTSDVADMVGVKPCTSLLINEQSGTVELILDGTAASYSQPIKGEGADIVLYREIGTDRVVGVRIQLLHKRLVIDRLGAIRHERRTQQELTESQPQEATAPEANRKTPSTPDASDETASEKEKAG